MVCIFEKNVLYFRYSSITTKFRAISSDVIHHQCRLHWNNPVWVWVEETGLMSSDCKINNSTSDKYD